MFIFKKFQKPQDSSPSTPPSLSTSSSLTALSAYNQNGTLQTKRFGVQPMDQFLQRKFARGIHYNMKIIIRGDRNVGKTCLFYRLQGEKFHEEYIASDEIKTASIQWNYNATDDVIKVEIWDVVDKGKKRENLIGVQSMQQKNAKDSLKMHNIKSSFDSRNKISVDSVHNHQSDSQSLSSTPALDAEFVDVYKGTNGVIFVFDMTKAWTFDYVVREINKCPLNIPVLILANHRDMGHHRVITTDQVQSFIESILIEDQQFNRERSGQILYAESSMRNGFGLRFLYKFFNLPYLHLRREALLNQLSRNATEIEATRMELDAMNQSEEFDYDRFLEMITNKRRAVADQLSAISSTKNATNILSKNEAIIENSSNGNNRIEPIQKPTPSIIIGANVPLEPKFQNQLQMRSSLSQRVSSSDLNQSNPKIVPGSKSSVKNIEDFVPDDCEQSVFRKFLDEASFQQDVALKEDSENYENTDEDDDEYSDTNQINIAKYQEELDPEDLLIHSNQSEFPNNKIEKSKIIESLDPEPISPQNIADNNENMRSIQLNCDDLDVLDNLHISIDQQKKHPQSNQTNHLDDENDQCDKKICDILEKSTTSSNNRKTKSSNKKTKTAKNKKNQVSSSSSSSLFLNGTIDKNSTETELNSKKKLELKKSKSKSLTKKSKASVDEDRNRLEEFLGTDDDENDKNASERRDPTTYQMF
ncbi:Rab-like protein 6 [Sarcoptes scabiei]|uniref:Rab-like protein 6 n=1 Tax=Sarcoptes scabiei TaxID=52283 RepID=A0A834RDI1_SARSC|nr:Rab-like protein 6 [Sarcoptes scabiei]